MSWSISLLGIAGLICVSLYRFIVQPIFTSPLAKIPIPHWSCAISSVWFDRQKRQKRACKTLYEAHQKLGEIVRLSPREVSVSSLEGMRLVYASGLEKDPWYEAEFRNYETLNLVSMIDHKSHSVQKRMITGVYAKSFVLHSEDFAFVQHQLLEERWLPLIDGAAASRTPIDVLSLSQWAGADFTTGYLLGSSNCTKFLLDEDKARSKYFTPLRGLSFDSKPFMEQYLMGKCRSAIAMLDREPKGASKPVVLSKLYNGLKTSIGTGPEPSEGDIIKACASEIFDHNIAGHETTSITLTYVFWRMSQEPLLQVQLRKEILDARSSAAHADMPPPAILDKLPLLNAILFETLRLHAAAPSQQPRIVRGAGLDIHGFHLPDGTRVSANAYTFHRHAATYRDPSSWVPRRWLSDDDDDDEEKKKKTTKALMRWFWAFGSGGRMCIGSNLAIAMLKSLIASVYSNYRTTIVDDEGIEQADDFIAGPVGGKLIVQFHKVGEGVSDE